MNASAGICTQKGPPNFIENLGKTEQIDKYLLDTIFIWTINGFELQIFHV